MTVSDQPRRSGEPPGSRSRRSRAGSGQLPRSGAPAGRPRDPHLDTAILAAAERLLGERGYARMSLEAVAAAAGTTAPSLRRRYRGKPELVTAVIDSLRAEPLPPPAAHPREDALAILANFQRNLERPHTMATLGTILAEEDRHPALLGHFRARLVQPRRALLRQALADGVSAGDLPAGLDLDAAAAMLIGACYARYVSGEGLPSGWPQRLLNTLWPPPPVAPGS